MTSTTEAPASFVDLRSPNGSHDDYAYEAAALVNGLPVRQVGVKSGRRPCILAGSLGVAAAGAVAVMFARGGTRDCIPGGASSPLVSLSETSPEEFPADFDHEDATQRWLETATAVGAGDIKDTEKVASTLRQAMSEGDPKKAQEVVKLAMERAVVNTREKRRQLKKTNNKRKLFFHKTTTPPPPNDMEIKTATCVFDVLSATTSVVAVAANINDVSKTCHHVSMKQFFNFKGAKPGVPTNVHAKICAINAIAVLGNLVSIATGLALAADSCATTIIPNLDAKCSAAVTGLVTAVAALAGGGTLISGACRNAGWYNNIPPGLAPSNVGSNYNLEHPEVLDGMPDIDLDTRRLAAPEEEIVGEHAPDRQLLFGGGKGSTATHCSTEIASTMWLLAAFALSINAVGNQDQARSCPPTDIFGGTNRKGLGFDISEGFCTLDVTAAITSIMQLIVVLQLLTVNCLDVLNIQAICGAGIGGLLAGASAIAQASTGVWMACDVFQKQPLKRIINLARGIDQRTGIVTDLAVGDSGLGLSFNLGRRLEESDVVVEQTQDQMMEDVGVNDLKKRFSTPEEAFKSIGVSLDNSTSLKEMFDRAVARTKPRGGAGDFVSLMEQVQGEQQHRAGGEPDGKQFCEDSQ